MIIFAIPRPGTDFENLSDVLHVRKLGIQRDVFEQYKSKLLVTQVYK